MLLNNCFRGILTLLLYLCYLVIAHFAQGSIITFIVFVVFLVFILCIYNTKVLSNPIYEKIKQSNSTDFRHSLINLLVVILSIGVIFLLFYIPYLEPWINGGTIKGIPPLLTICGATITATGVFIGFTLAAERNTNMEIQNNNLAQQKIAETLNSHFNEAVTKLSNTKQAVRYGAISAMMNVIQEFHQYKIDVEKDSKNTNPYIDNFNYRQTVMDVLCRHIVDLSSNSRFERPSVQDEIHYVMYSLFTNNMHTSIIDNKLVFDKNGKNKLTEGAPENEWVSYKPLNNAKIIGMKALRGAKLRGASLKNAIITDSDLTGADLSYANLYGSTFRNTSFKNAKLHYVNILNTDFTGADITGTCMDQYVQKDPNNKVRHRLIDQEAIKTEIQAAHQHLQIQHIILISCRTPKSDDSNLLTVKYDKNEVFYYTMSKTHTPQTTPVKEGF